jgi:hypothetical protein
MNARRHGATSPLPAIGGGGDSRRRIGSIRCVSLDELHTAMHALALTEANLAKRPAFFWTQEPDPPVTSLSILPLSHVITVSVSVSGDLKGLHYFLEVGSESSFSEVRR